MFIDRAKIYLVAGNGGDGAISFRHEKCVDKGGPNGGNGGHGASIYFIAKSGISTLGAYRHAIKVKAEDGDKGHQNNAFGHAGQDVWLDVPTGTVVLTEDGQVLADLSVEGESYLACKGGRGGRGNTCFKSSRNRTPMTAENGTPAEKKTLVLELKLIADVGFVGLPSVGKSTLLSVISNATPKIADYPFTTLEPMLGAVKLSETESFVAADLPGLIEGAHLGKGLGMVFLRHIERCRVIVHVIDISREEEDPFKSFNTINTELEDYRLDLLARPMIVALNKCDCAGCSTRIAKFKEDMQKAYGDKYPIFEISALTKTGLKPLLRKAYDLVQHTPNFTIYKPEENSEATYDAKKIIGPIFKVMKLSDNYYEIKGERVVKTYKLINHMTEEGMMKLMSYLSSIGVNTELTKLGAKDGSRVRLDDFEFEFYN